MKVSIIENILMMKWILKCFLWQIPTFILIKWDQKNFPHRKEEKNIGLILIKKVFNKLNLLEINQQENKKVDEYFRKNDKYTKFL